MRTVNGKPIRERGGKRKPTFAFMKRESDDRPSALRKGLPIIPATPTSTAQLTVGAAIHSEHTDIEETAEAYIVPRKSLTTKLHLRMFDQDREFTSLKPSVRLQRGKNLKPSQFIHGRTMTVSYRDADGNVQTFDAELDPRLIESTDEHKIVSWKSDRTLLSRTKPDLLERIDFKRTSARSKVTRTTKELSAEKAIDQLLQAATRKMLAAIRAGDSDLARQEASTAASLTRILDALADTPDLDVTF